MQACCVPQRIRVHWLNHYKLFQQCLADVSKGYLDVAFPFGIKRLAEKVYKGDVKALMFLLKYRGKM